MIFLALTYLDYLRALKSSIIKPIIRLDFLRNEDFTVYNTVTASLENGSGTLSVQRQNGIRKTLDFTLINTNGQYSISPDTIYWRSKFKLYLGLEINGEDFLIPQGIFVIDDPEVVSKFSERKVNIHAIDLFGELDGSLGGELPSIYKLPLNTDMITAINQVLTESSISTSTIVDTSIIGKTTPYTIEKTYGSDTYGDLLIELAQIYSCNCYFNEDGNLVVEKDELDKNKASLWDFTTEEFNYLGSNIKYKFSEVYNSVYVIGANINGAIVKYKAQNNNLLDPNSIPNIGFERVKIMEEPNLETQEQCQNLAEYWLKRTTASQNEISISSVPMYHLQADEIITLTDPQQNLDRERFLINSYSIPLKIGGEMSITAVKSQDLDFE